MPDHGRDPAAALVDAIRSCFQEAQLRHGELAAEFDHVLAHTRHLQPCNALHATGNDAARSHLSAAIEAGKKGPAAAVAEALEAVGFDLPWRYSYPDHDPLLSANVAFAELVGPRGPFYAEELRLGFTLIGPDILYPAHAHPAIELYHLIAGPSRWTAGPVSQDMRPGAFILHPSNVVHAMQTRDQPLLATYCWRGDILKPSVYV